MLYSSALLCPPHCCDIGGVLTNRADLTTTQLERSLAESQGTFSGGPSLFLKMSRIMRERDSKSCKVIFEISNGLDPSKCHTARSPEWGPSICCTSEQLFVFFFFSIAQLMQIAQVIQSKPFPHFALSPMPVLWCRVSVMAKWWLENGDQGEH